MEKSLKKILLLRDELKITMTQAMTLMAMKHGMYNIDIRGDEMFELRKMEFIKGNKLTAKTHEIVDELLSRRAGASKSVVRRAYNSKKPILDKETAEIVKELAKVFVDDRFTELESSRINEYTKANPLISPFIFMFMEMFPSSDPKKNAVWNKHFDTVYENVTLRRLSQGTVNKLISIWNKKDIGLFLLGTYLYVKQTRNEDSGKYFVMKIENYLKEWEHWFTIAEDLKKEGKLEAITKRAKKTTSTNTFVV